MPTLILVDKGGVIKWRHQGYVVGEEVEIEEQIKQVLGKSIDEKIRDKATCYTFGTFLISSSLVIANDIGFSGAVNASYGNSYDFYNFSENLLDLNFFF